MQLKETTQRLRERPHGSRSPSPPSSTADRVPVDTHQDVPLLAPTWSADSTTATDFTFHQLAPYIGRMKTSMAQALVRQYTRAGDLVVDPFCGCGVVAMEAAAHGRGVKVGDWNPYAVLLTHAKLFPPANLRGRCRIAHLNLESSTYEDPQPRPEVRPSLGTPLLSQRDSSLRASVSRRLRRTARAFSTRLSPGYSTSSASRVSLISEQPLGSVSP